jgi:hypothetical protein
MKKIKNSIFLIIFFLIFISIVFLNNNNDFKILKRETIYPILKIVKNNEILKYINLGYKNVFLPSSAYGKIDFFQKKISLNNLTYKANYGYGKNYYKPFYIENYKNYIFIIERNGNIKKFPSKNLNSDINKIDGIKIKSNIKKFDNIYILDTLIIKDEIFISFRSEDLKCKKFNIIKSNIKESLNFEILYKPNECGENIQAGSMQHYKMEEKEGILFTLSNPFSLVKNETNLSQNNNSIFGKIHFLNFHNFKTKIFANGFRNNQGLHVDSKCILSTDHGPEGGDEINNIKINKNYGWPIASYGEPYEKNDIIDYKFPYFLKSHKDNNFEEPVFSFLPSIAISRLIKVPDNFSNLWKDNYLFATLNAKSIYRVKFDEQCHRVIYFEKIFIGSRIRDMTTSKDGKKIYLALENSGSVGVLQDQK